MFNIFMTPEEKIVFEIICKIIKDPSFSVSWYEYKVFTDPNTQERLVGYELKNKKEEIEIVPFITDFDYYEKGLTSSGGRYGLSYRVWKKDDESNSEWKQLVARNETSFLFRIKLFFLYNKVVKPKVKDYYSKKKQEQKNDAKSKREKELAQLSSLNSKKNHEVETLKMQTYIKDNLK